jgi:hypothetical protein
VANTRLKLSLTLENFLSEGETFKIGPFSAGSLIPTPNKNELSPLGEDIGDPTRCSIQAPNGVFISKCVFTDTTVSFSVEVIEAQDVTFLLVDLVGFNNPSTASVPSADIHRLS